MIIHRMEQYSPEWWEVRKNLPTASSADKIVTPTGKISTQSEGLIDSMLADALDVAGERWEGNEHTERGHELEPEARKFFTFETGLLTTEVGFITNETKTAGASPDSLVPHPNTDDVWKAGLEIKCPMGATHIGYIRGGVMPKKYLPQCHWGLAVSGLPEWYFLSYHPNLDPVLHKVVPNEFTDTLKRAIAGFAIKYRDAAKQFGIEL